MDDLDFATGGAEPSNNDLDPAYSFYQDGLGDEVAERRVGNEPIPPFTHYVLKPVDGRGQVYDSNTAAKVRVEVLEGPGDTVGRSFFDSGGIFFGVKRTSFDRKTKTEVVLSDADYAKKVQGRKNLLNRIAYALKLSDKAPRSFDQAGLDAYAEQFKIAAPFVADVRVERGQDGVSRNRIVWESVAAIGEAVTDPKTKRPIPNKTALDEAREKIAAKDKAGSGKARGRTAAALTGDRTSVA